MYLSKWIPVDDSGPSATSFKERVSRITSKFDTFTWQTGIKLSLGICLFSLSANVILLCVAVSTHGKFTTGIGVLNTGQSKKLARLSATYHLLINVLSTGLLTSSNFCTQLLCAPTRHDVDVAHARGQWLEVGILSFRNLLRISRRRMILW